MPLITCRRGWLFLAIVSSPMARGADVVSSWPQWRGPQAAGVAESGNPPIRWSETENVRWKVAVPGLGSSSPIVLGDRVYVTTAVPTDRVREGSPEVAAGAEDSLRQRQTESDDREPQESAERGRRGRGRFGNRAAPTHYHTFLVLAYDRATGQEVWRTTVTEQVPHEPGHATNSQASASPLTDGERLYVSFGSRGVYALDLQGHPLWHCDLGKMETRNQFGEGSSPALHDGKLVVPFDHEGDSFIAALDAPTGRELWRQPRDERTTWATPLITEFEGRAQVITNGAHRVRSYDLESGRLIWECGGQAGNPIPTPVRFEDSVIVMTGYGGYAIYSIPLSAEGDITGSETIGWFEEDAAPYVPSPVLYQGQLYFVKGNNGILVSRNARSGQLVIDQTRLPGISSIYASPVAAADRIYFTGRDGTTVVLRHGDRLEILATNRLDEEIDASAAIVDDELFQRGKRHLYCIAE